MKFPVMTEKHYRYLLQAAPQITHADTVRLEKFIPNPTPIARAVFAAYNVLPRRI